MLAAFLSGDLPSHLRREIIAYLNTNDQVRDMLGMAQDAMGVGREDLEDAEVIDFYFANAMNYLRRQPTIWVHQWPGGHDAAAMLTGSADTRSKIEAFLPIVDLLEEENAPGSHQRQ